MELVWADPIPADPQLYAVRKKKKISISEDGGQQKEVIENNRTACVGPKSKFISLWYYSYYSW